MKRTFTEWIDNVGYDLDIVGEKGDRSNVSWRIKDEGQLSSTLSIIIKPYLAKTTPRGEAQIHRLMGRYLELSLKGAKYYLETGTPVRRNQFGAHHMFSPPISDREDSYID